MLGGGGAQYALAEMTDKEQKLGDVVAPRNDG